MTPAANDRRIRKLSLRVSDRSHVYRAAGLIEEAFRLASLPGESEGRSYHFRFLNLGKIRPHERVSLLTLRLQREFLRLIAEAVPVEDPRAPFREAVYFQSPLEPIRYALGRLANGRRALDTWFLRSAFPDLSPTLSPAEAVQYLLEACSHHPGGIVNVAQVLDELLVLGELGPLLAVLNRQIAAQLMAGFPGAPTAAQLIEGSFGAPTAVSRARSVHIPTGWVSVIQQALRLWGAQDIRTLWLASSALLVEVPARLSDPGLPAAAQTIIASISSAPAPVMTDRQPDDTPPGPETFSAECDTTPQPDASQPLHSEESSSLVERSYELTRRQAAATEMATEELNGAPVSRYCGFYFLLHVLRNLGIAEFLRDHPRLLNVNFPWILLRTLANHIGIGEDDPVLSFAPVIPDADLRHKCVVKMPEAWRRLVPDALLDQPIERDASFIARAWVVAVRRWLWRYGELRIADVTRKLGQVAYIRPQVDITLLLHEVDVRVRRLGLDLDLGWVPWLGLIVRFHYERALGDSYDPRHD
jgi:hypothetical protein